MGYAFRKQTKSDFTSRIQRVDNRLDGRSRADDKTQRRPFRWTLAGFGWCYLVVIIANRKDHIRDSLGAGSLPAHLHDAVLAGLAALLAISGVMLVLHLIRYVTKRGAAKANSGNLILGAVAALALVYTPSEVFQMGFGMLDENSRSIILAAQAGVKDSVPGIDWGSVVMVASNGR